MNYGSFSILSKVQDIDITPDKINGVREGIKSYLSIIAKFTFRPPYKGAAFDVIAVKAKLKIHNPSILISETQIFLDANIRWQQGSEKQEREYNPQFNFLIDDFGFNAIKKHRDGDIAFEIEFEMMVLLKSEIEIDGKLIRTADSTLKDAARVSCIVPRSVWVEKIMPGLGMESLRLIEIPLTHKVLKEAYKDIIFEFNKAEESFNDQKWDDCVSHCRLTLDALTRNLKKIKEGVESETAFKWLEKIDKATFAWIDELNRSSAAITSKPHHTGHKRKFQMYEAQAIYMVVLGLLHYVGNYPKN